MTRCKNWTTFSSISAQISAIQLYFTIKSLIKLQMCPSPTLVSETCSGSGRWAEDSLITHSIKRMESNRNLWKLVSFARRTNRDKVSLASIITVARVVWDVSSDMACSTWTRVIDRLPSGKNIDNSAVDNRGGITLEFFESETSRTFQRAPTRSRIHFPSEGDTSNTGMVTAEAFGQRKVLCSKDAYPFERLYPQWSWEWVTLLGIESVWW